MPIRKFLIFIKVLLFCLILMKVQGQVDSRNLVVDESAREPLLIGFYWNGSNKADDDLIGFVNKNFVYSAELLKSEAFGVLKTSWVVEKDSTISSPRIIKDIGYGIGEELLRILNHAVEEHFIYASPYLAQADRILVTREFELLEGILKKEKIPRFPGCENLATLDEKIECAEKKLNDFIYKNIIYPKEAKAKGVTGTVIVSWIVERDGKVSFPEIINDIGNGCGKEVLRVMNFMNEQNLRWTPASSRYPPIRVKFTKEIYFTEEMLNRP